MYPYLDQSESLSLESLMNGPVRKALGIQVTHGKQSDQVFTTLSEDFMKPVIHIGISQIYRKKVIATKERNTCGLIEIVVWIINRNNIISKANVKVQ